MALSDGLISYWKLDESSGTRDDAHGTNDLTDNNTVGSGTGKINAAADFVAASSEYLDHADNADLSFGDEAFTINCWVKADALGTSAIVGKWASSGSVATCEYALRSVAGVFDWRVGDGSANTNKAHSSTPSTGTWYMLTVYHDPGANEIGIAVNGGSFETASHSTGVLDGAGGFALGRPGDFDGQYWDGLIDEVGLWGRVLSSSEVGELYNSGAGLAYPFGATAGPVRRRARAAIEPAFEYHW